MLEAAGEILGARTFFEIQARSHLPYRPTTSRHTYAISLCTLCRKQNPSIQREIWLSAARREAGVAVIEGADEVRREVGGAAVEVSRFREMLAGLLR